MEQEIKNGTYTIPEGFTAKIENGKIIVEKAESEDEKIRIELIRQFGFLSEMWFKNIFNGKFTKEQIIDYLKKQKEQNDLPKWEESDLIDRADLHFKRIGGKAVICYHNRMIALKDLKKLPGFYEDTEDIKSAEQNEEDKTNGWTGVDSERYLSCLQRLGTGDP